MNTEELIEILKKNPNKKVKIQVFNIESGYNVDRYDIDKENILTDSNSDLFIIEVTK